MSEQEAYALIIAGDDAGLVHIYVNYRDRFVRQALSKLRAIGPTTQTDADEYFYQAMAILGEQSHTGKLKKYEPKNIGGFIHKTMVNLHRTRVRRRPLPLLSGVDRELSEEQIHIARMTVRKLLDQMGNPCAKLLQLFHLDGFKIKEVADLTEFTAHTVRNKLAECRKKMRRLFNL